MSAGCTEARLGSTPPHACCSACAVAWQPARQQTGTEAAWQQSGPVAAWQESDPAAACASELTPPVFWHTLCFFLLPDRPLRSAARAPAGTKFFGVFIDLMRTILLCLAPCFACPAT